LNQRRGNWWATQHPAPAPRPGAARRPEKATAQPFGGISGNQRQAPRLPRNEGVPGSSPGVGFPRRPERAGARSSGRASRRGARPLDVRSADRAIRVGAACAGQRLTRGRPHGSGAAVRGPRPSRPVHPRPGPAPPPGSGRSPCGCRAMA
jgi:hypothetical protein